MNDHLKNIICFICLVSAIVVAVIAMFMPIVGVIDSSVLWFTAQLLLMCTSIIGIKVNFSDVFKSHKDKSK